MKGVDVSYHNGYVDWESLRSVGIKFAICRTGYGKNGFDETFARNVNDARRAGLICGAYHYSYALTPSDAIIEAQFCKRIIHESGVLLELPIFFDMEDADGYKLRHNFNFTRQNVTNICHAFLEVLRPLECGVYASYSWLEKYIDWRSLNCPVWNAQWGSRDYLRGYMWQFTENLLINGRPFDGNVLYSC